MAQLKLASQPGSLYDPAVQREFREQIAVLNDAVRQLAGRGEVAPGTTINDPLNAPYVLYVNPYTGVDTFAGGSYATGDDGSFEQKMRRIDNQRLVCGYTAARPFRTINRAVIEAGIITSKSWFTIPNICGDLVSIVLAPGFYTVLNAPAEQGTAPTAWSDGHTPTDAELIGFNPSVTGGVLLPRGCSLCGMDLRKTMLQPGHVPPVADEQRTYDALTGVASYPNRTTIFKTTGNGYYFGFSFIDNQETKSSHHLLSCFGYASKAELDTFYSKIATAVGGGTNLGNVAPALLHARPSEYELVGPQPAQNPTEATDTTGSSSAYIFNCSIRSNYGLGGCFLDGARTEGFKSTVLAQFTGVSLQRDLSCWEVYDITSTGLPGHENFWRPPVDYNEFKSAGTDPDSIRFNPKRRSCHIRAINDAFAQEVSVFAIGQGVHHWTETGGELTITNSNSNFGGVSALSEGYKLNPFPLDGDWNISAIRVASNLQERTGNVRRIVLGTVASDVANDATTIKLAVPLADSTRHPGIPELLDRDKYSLVPGSYIWIDNPTGNDWRARLTAAAWDPATPDLLQVEAAFVTQDGKVPGGEETQGEPPNTITITLPNLAGKQVYLRRLVDTRPTEARRYSLRVVNTNVTRLPVRDFALQVDATQSTVINDRLPLADPILVNTSARIDSSSGTMFEAVISLRRGAGGDLWKANTIYRPGDVVRYQQKHFSCTEEHQSAATFDPTKFSESFVHMESRFQPEDNWRNEAVIVTFDGDSDGNDNTQTCGYDLNGPAWNRPEIEAQYRTATDYKAIHLLLVQLGFSNGDAHTILRPAPADGRDLNPTAPLYGLPAPSGAASAWANWPIQFHRPSMIRLFGHAWEWSGFGNYTRALPAYQGEMSPQNKISYFFTNANGGRVYGTGFNEDGYGISPYGITDISTGQTLSVDQIGASNTDPTQVEFPTSFQALTCTSLTVNGPATINGDLTATKYKGLPVAGTAKAGIAEVATPTQVQNAFNDGTVASASNNEYPDAQLVVSLSGMTGLKAAVLAEIKLLEKKYCRFYVDGNVTIANGVVSNVPTAIWQDLAFNAAFHDIKSFDPAGPIPGEAQDIANRTVYKSLDQVFAFLNDRSPIGTSRITIYFYGASTVAGSLSYAGTTDLSFQRGPSFAGDADKRAGLVDLGNRTITIPNPQNIAFADLNLKTTSADGILVAGSATISVGNIWTWNSRFELNSSATGRVQMFTGNAMSVFSRPFWDGPSATRSAQCAIDAVFNATPTGGAIAIFNAYFWGRTVDIFTRRGATAQPGNIYTDSGPRSFTLTLTDKYLNTTGGVKDFTLFRCSDGFRYTAGAYNASDPAIRFGADWTINLRDYNGGGLYFLAPNQPQTSIGILFAESLFAADTPGKQSTVTLTRAGGVLPPTTSFALVRQCTTTDFWVSSDLPTTGAKNNSFIHKWANAIKTLYATEQPDYDHTIIEWAGGSLINDTFRVDSAQVDVWAPSTDSGQSRGLIAWRAGAPPIAAQAKSLADETAQPRFFPEPLEADLITQP